MYLFLECGEDETCTKNRLAFQDQPGQSTCHIMSVRYDQETNMVLEKNKEKTTTYFKSWAIQKAKLPPVAVVYVTGNTDSIIDVLGCWGDIARVQFVLLKGCITHVGEQKESTVPLLVEDESTLLYDHNLSVNFETRISNKRGEVKNFETAIKIGDLAYAFKHPCMDLFEGRSDVTEMDVETALSLKN